MLGHICLLALCIALLQGADAFRTPLYPMALFNARETLRPLRSQHQQKLTSLSMGLFDGIFGSKATASASHILMKNKEGEVFLTELKQKLSKSSNLKADFADAAAKYSTCPSSKNGGALGTFKQGAMVPAFDKVVFSEEIGVVHGPVKTPFGAHLILIDGRSS